MIAGLQILSRGILKINFTENYRAIPYLGDLPGRSEVLPIYANGDPSILVSILKRYAEFCP